MSEGRGLASAVRARAASKSAIRPMRRADLPRVIELIRGLARYEKLEREVRVTGALLAAHLWGGRWPRLFGLVARSERRLTGYALYYGTVSSFSGLPRAWLEDLYVEESERGTGLGQVLLGEVARRASARGATKLDWGVLEWNRPAIRFYESLGATRQGGWYSYRLEGPALKRVAAGRFPRSRKRR